MSNFEREKNNFLGLDLNLILLV